MGQPAARIGDMHVCPMVTPGTPPVPHVGGPITGPGVPNVLIGGKPAAVMGDMCVCTGPPDSIIKGSLGVHIGGKPAARMGDFCAHGGTITLGQPNVLIGELMPSPPEIVMVLAKKPMIRIKKKALEKVNTLKNEAQKKEGQSKAMANQVVTLLESSFSGKPFCKVCEEKAREKKAKEEKENEEKVRSEELKKEEQKARMDEAAQHGDSFVPKL
jgi:uncharacterized Zn-binding protein involved in type VI secretion